MLRTWLSRLFVGVIGFAIAACADPTGSVTHEDRPEPISLAVQCLPGCLEEDPNPSAPGVFLTSAVSDETCFRTGGNDTDGDGLINQCETDLAYAFAPELFYYQFDEVGREPHWVAQKSTGGRVFIGYLLSYYRDAGNSSFGCSVPFAPSSCYGHNGDSETIFLEVYYNAGTQHWVLHQARYSQHGSDAIFFRGSYAYPPQLYYPGRPGAYPRAWVSQGKHANYASEAACNGGGTLNSDDCRQTNTRARVAATGLLNIGSRAVHTTSQDCMRSSNPSYIYYNSGRQECYWTNRNFRGWIPTSVGGAESTPYSSILSAHGF